MDSQKREVEHSLGKAEAAERAARAAEEDGRKLLYTTDMRLAAFLWSNESTAAEQYCDLLAKHIPVSTAAANENVTHAVAKSDLRGFEWYYQQNLLTKGVAVFSGHDAPVVAGAFTSSEQLVTLDGNSQVRRWNLGNGQEDEGSRRDLPVGVGTGESVLSPNGLLAARAEGNKLRLFDTSSGRETLQVDSTADLARHLIFSPDGALLVIVDDRIRWFNCSTGEQVATFDQKFDRVNSLALSADGLALAVVGHGAWSGDFSIFRLDPITKSVAVLANHTGTSGSKLASVLSPDGQRLVISFPDGNLGVVDTKLGRFIGYHPAAHPSRISVIGFSSDGSKLATGDDVGTIKVWDVSLLLLSKSKPLLTLKGHQGTITSVGFSRDGKSLGTTSSDKTARVWDLRTAGVPSTVLEGFHAPVNCRAGFSFDGQLIAAPANPLGLNGGAVGLWEVSTGKLVRELPAGSESQVYSLACSPTDPRLIAVGHGAGIGVSYVSLWDIVTGTELARLPGATDLPTFDAWDYPAGAVGTLSFSRDGKILVAGFGARHYQTRKRFPSPIHVWDVATRRLIQRLDEHQGFCTSLDFSRDGKLLAAASRCGTAKIWSTETWHLIHTLENPDRGALYDDVDVEEEEIGNPAGYAYIESLAFSPDGKMLALGSFSGSVQLWNVVTGTLDATLKGHYSDVSGLAFSPNGRTLASGSADRTVRLWNVETRRELMQMDPGRVELGRIRALEFSPDGEQLLAVGAAAVVWSASANAWNDPDRAAARLRLLLNSNVDFLGWIRMLSSSLHLDKALEKLEKLAPGDIRVPAALAECQARQIAKQGDAALADAARTKARALFAELLVKDPGNEGLAAALAQLLFDQLEFGQPRPDAPSRNRVSAAAKLVGRSLEEKRNPALKPNDPWACLAIAYHLLGEQPAFEELVKQHPAAATIVGDLYAAVQNWERAIIEYTKALTNQPNDGALLLKLAEAYHSTGRTRDGLPYLVRVSIANPQDTILSLDVAALQAWFGQGQEYAATRQRILASAAGTGDATTADRAAKACSILPASDPAELAAVLALGRQAGELGNTDPLRAWCQTALGMAEYRNGNYEAADRALLAAVEAGPDNPLVMGIAPFYRAMSLYRQGKVDAARQLATETAVRMKPLPGDEQNPLGGDILHSSHNDLILWLACKEAKDLIHFTDAAENRSP